MSLNALGCLICGQFTATSVHGIPEWSLQSGPGEACLCAMEETSNAITGMALCFRIPSLQRGRSQESSY
jgi:hypothetical protein